MKKDNLEESNKILEEEKKHMLFSQKEVDKARSELNLLGVDSDKLYDFNTMDNDDEIIDDEDYYRKSA